MSLKGRLILLTTMCMAFDQAQLQGRKLTDYEIRHRKHKQKFAASKKPPLTLKQQIARAKNKRAKQARKRNRKNKSLQLSKVPHKIHSHKDNHR